MKKQSVSFFRISYLLFFLSILGIIRIFQLERDHAKFLAEGDPFKTSRLGLNRAPSSIESADGIYHISGVSTKYGAYTGTAWIYQSKVQRKIRFANYKYNDHLVELIWSGVASNTELTFATKLSNTLTSYEDYVPSATELNTQYKIRFKKQSLPFGFMYTINTEGTFKEFWTYKQAATSTPLWVNLRKMIDVTGQGDDLVKSVVNVSGIRDVIFEYRKSEITKPYLNYPAFKEAKQYYYEDHTDADFYKNNPNIIRIVNKVINPLSLVEALMKKNAFGKSYSSKENYFRNQILTNNLNSAGMLEHAFLDSATDKKNGRMTDGDSALWTSLFSWSELLRYQASKDPNALENFKKMLNAILTLVEITENPKEFARSLAVSGVEENLGNDWTQGKGANADVKWLKGGNNDMSKGVLLTLILANQISFSDEPLLKNRIKNVVAKLRNLTPMSSGSNFGIARGLNYLWNDDSTGFTDFFNEVFSIKTGLSEFSKLKYGVYLGGVADWSGINLMMTSNLIQNLLALELQKKKLADSRVALKISQIKRNAEDSLVEMHKLYAPIKRDFITIMIYATNPRARADVNFTQIAQNALWTLREIPAPRNIGNMSANLKLKLDWSASAWPRLPWKHLESFGVLKKNIDYEYSFQGAYAYPIYELGALNQGYLWIQNPFNFNYSSTKNFRSHFVDYQLLYWASRSVGLIEISE